LNRVKIDMVRKGEMLSADDVTDILAISIIGIIPEDPGVIPASNSGIPVTLNENSRAGQALNNIARRLMGETVPFMQLDSNNGLFQRLVRLIAGGQGE
jgi:septum site-determining protein MinD